jgi:hypothetical protein
MAESYPLAWPDGWKRTAYRKNSAFAIPTIGAVSKRVLKELKLLGASSVVVSTNLMLRSDGLPYSNQRQPEDPGVAVYFLYKDKRMCFACDSYRKIEENLVAIAKTIEALRGMARWGASQMMERAFTGFSALPAKTGREWWEILNVSRQADKGSIETQFRYLAKTAHPDTPTGSHQAMAELNRAREEALKEVTA